MHITLAESAKEAIEGAMPDKKSFGPMEFNGSHESLSNVSPRSKQIEPPFESTKSLSQKTFKRH